jgi:hypothetical protein
MVPRKEAQACFLPLQRGAFTEEDGERVIDENGRRVARA